MKRTILLLFSIIGAAFCADAQILSIQHSGEALSSEYEAKINRTLRKEVEFFGPIGIPSDTIRVKLVIFKDMDAANKFIRQYNPLAYGRYCGGMFIPSIETAVITTTEDMERAVKIVFHEISHFLYHKAMDSSPVSSTSSAASLNEGLASYFEFMKVKKDGTVSQKPDMEYLSSVKTLMEIDEFDIDEYLRMTHRQFEDKHRHDGVISYYVSYVITATLFEKLGTEQMRNLLITIRDGTNFEDAVETLYPGGKSGLGEDIRKKVIH